MPPLLSVAYSKNFWKLRLILPVQDLHSICILWGRRWASFKGQSPLIVLAKNPSISSTTVFSARKPSQKHAALPVCLFHSIFYFKCTPNHLFQRHIITSTAASTSVLKRSPHLHPQIACGWFEIKEGGRGVSAVSTVGLKCKNPYPTARSPFLLISHLSMWGG
jgi:hypothetical protein